VCVGAAGSVTFTPIFLRPGRALRPMSPAATMSERCPTCAERLARLEADLAHLARMLWLLEKGHATVADFARLREIAKIAERVEGSA